MNKERIVSFLRDTWYVLLISILAMAATYLMVKDFKQLPSPLYGGDIWNHLGTIYHMKYGGSFFDSGELLGETPWVPRLYHLYNLALAAITGWDPMVANLYDSIFLVPISAYCMWYISGRFTDNKFIRAAAIILFLGPGGYPFFKYTIFAYFVMMPLLLVAWFRYWDRQDDFWRQATLAVVMGLCSLTNTQLFFAAYILFGVFFLDKAYAFWKSGKRPGLNPETIAEFRPYALIFALSFAIALIYWFWPIFVYHISTPNDLQVYGWADFSKPDIQIRYPLMKLWYTFVNNVNLVDGAWRLMALAGAAIVFLRRNDPKYRLFFLVLVAATVSLFHHLLTYNLAHMQLGPERLFEMYMWAGCVVLFAIAAEAARERFSFGKYAPYVALALALLMFQNNFSYWMNPPEGGWEAMAKKSGLSPEVLSVQGWVLNNTGVYDVFLTDNEDAFMMNALTGRKAVTYRRTHTSTYADLDQRNLDSAIMFYGTNDTARSALLKKYNVKYVLWTPQFNRQLAFNEQGAVEYMYDPFMCKDTGARQKFLDSNGVSFMKLHFYLDPAAQPDYPMYDLLAIPPQGAGATSDRPWGDGMQAHLTELYKVEYPAAPSDYPPFAIIYGVSP